MYKQFYLESLLFINITEKNGALKMHCTFKHLVSTSMAYKHDQGNMINVYISSIIPSLFTSGTVSLYFIKQQKLCNFTNIRKKSITFCHFFGVHFVHV